MQSVLFFDLDGTLTDPQEGITKSIRYALAALGAQIPDQQRLVECIGPPLLESFFALLETTDRAVAEHAMVKYRERFEVVGMFENRVYDGIPEVLTALKNSGYRLLVATSKPHVYANKILEHFGLAHHFEQVFGPELDGTRREKDELLAYALPLVGAAPEHCLMIGDRKHDILGAHENGIKALAVTWGYGSHAELEEAGADGFVDEVKALEGAIAAAHPSPPPSDQRHS